jgi:hypothetical protein
VIGGRDVGGHFFEGLEGGMAFVGCWLGCCGGAREKGIEGEEGVARTGYHVLSDYYEATAWGGGAGDG